MFFQITNRKIDSLRTFIVSKSSDYKYKSIISAFRFQIIPGFDKDAENRITKYIIKYVNQWYFIGSTLDIAISQFKTPDILKERYRKVCALVRG